MNEPYISGGCNIFGPGDNYCPLLESMLLYPIHFHDYVNGKVQCNCLPTCQRKEFNYQVRIKVFFYQVMRGISCKLTLILGLFSFNANSDKSAIGQSKRCRIVPG